MKKKQTFDEGRLQEKLAAFMQALTDQNALDPVVSRMPPDYALADAMIVAGASSRRHAQGLADAVSRLCSEKGYEMLGMEGQETADWILVDCNDIIVHILRDESRNLYRLEELWARSAQNKENW